MTWNAYKTGLIAVFAGGAITGAIWVTRPHLGITARDHAELLGAVVERARAYAWWPSSSGYGTNYLYTPNVHVDVHGTNRVGPFPSRQMVYWSIPTALRALAERRSNGGTWNLMWAATNGNAKFHGITFARASAFGPYTCTVERVGQYIGSNAWNIATPDYANYPGWWETHIDRTRKRFPWETVATNTSGAITGYYSKSAWYSTNVLTKYAQLAKSMEWTLFEQGRRYSLTFPNDPTSVWCGVSGLYPTAAEALDNLDIQPTTFAEATNALKLASADYWYPANTTVEGGGILISQRAPQSWIAVKTMGIRLEEPYDATQFMAVAYACKNTYSQNWYPADATTPHTIRWHAIVAAPITTYAIQYPSEFNGQGMDLFDSGYYTGDRWSDTGLLTISNTTPFPTSPEWGPRGPPTNYPAYPIPWTFGEDDASRTERLAGWRMRTMGMAVRWHFSHCTNDVLRY